MVFKKERFFLFAFITKLEVEGASKEARKLRTMLNFSPCKIVRLYKVMNINSKIQKDYQRSATQVLWSYFRNVKSAYEFKNVLEVLFGMSNCCTFLSRSLQAKKYILYISNRSAFLRYFQTLLLLKIESYKRKVIQIYLIHVSCTFFIRIKTHIVHRRVNREVFLCIKSANRD